MNDISLLANLHFDSHVTKNNALSKIRASIEAFGNYLEEPLITAYLSQKGLLDGVDTARFDKRPSYTARHKPMEKLTNTRLWTLKFRYIDNVAPDRVEIDIHPLLIDNIPSSIHAVWDLMIYALPKFVEATSPTHAFFFGLDDHVNEDFLPIGDNIYPLQGIPRIFTPWMFISDKNITDKTQSWIQNIPAHTIKNIKGGWFIQVVSTLYDNPQKDFIEYLQNTPVGRISYHQVIINSK